MILIVLYNEIKVSEYESHEITGLALGTLAGPQKGSHMTTPLNGSILKGFAVLRLFSPERPEISAAIVASELGMTTATAHRFLLTLEEAGALYSFQRGKFTLARWFQEMGQLAEMANPLADRVQPVIDRIARALNESVMACQLARTGPTCIAVARSDRPISVDIRVGTVLPIANTAQGKVFLANMDKADSAVWLDGQPLPTDLKDVRSRGFAQNRGENEPDIGAVSVPVRNTTGQVVLTVSVFGMLSRFNADFVARAVKSLKSETSGIEL